MKDRDYVVLRKILNYCNQIEETCKRFDDSYENYRNDFVFTNAANMCILQIGELCKALSDEALVENPCVPWKEWKGIRDVFAHQYSNLDYESAWDTIKIDLPALKAEVAKLVGEN